MSPIVKQLISEKIRKIFIQLNSLQEDGTFYEAFDADCDELLENICQDLDVLLYDIERKAST